MSDVHYTFRIDQQGHVAINPPGYISSSTVTNPPPFRLPTTAELLDALSKVTVVTEVEILRVENAKLREQVARLENDLAAVAVLAAAFAPAPSAPMPTERQQRDTAVGAAIFRTRRQDQLRQPQPCHDGI